MPVLNNTPRSGGQHNDDLADILGAETLVEAALKYARRGWAVFPLLPDLKVPFKGTTGHLAATTDLATVQNWWRKNPDANIGLHLAASGLVAIDPDTYKSGCGWREFIAGKHLPETYCQNSASGGRHYIFTAPPGSSFPDSLCKEVEIKHNGYVVLAPSTFEGRRYEVECDVSPVPAPEWIPRHHSVPVDDLSDILGDDDDYLLEAIICGPLDLTAAEVREILALLPNDGEGAHYDEYLRVGMALHHQYEGGDEGLALFIDWAKQSDKFEERNARGRWRSFGRRSNGSPVTLRSLIVETNWRRTITVDGFPATEDGIAQAFAARHAEDLRFCHSAGAWFRWTGNHWQREQTRLAFDFARKLAREFAQSEELSEAQKRTLGKAATPSGVETLARADRAFAMTAEAWNADPWLLGTPGGTVEMRSGRIRAAEPGECITKVTASAPVPIDTFAPAKDCPRWAGFLRDATGDDVEATRFLQQWAGYCLTGDTREEALLFVHGPGGSGKSTFIETLAWALGDYAVNVPTATLTAQKWAAHPTEIARLHGHRLAYASETEQGRAWNENRIKELTGGDTISARFMHKDFFEFRPQFKLTIVGNNRPGFANVDGAIRRRFNVMPFDRKPERPDHGLKEALGREMPGILTWAILGCLDWQRNGLMRPAIVTTTTEDYLAEQDTFARWIEDRCDVASGLADTVDHLFRSWAMYARDQGEDPGNRRNTFAERMRQHGFHKIKNTNGILGRGFAGLRVTDDDPFSELDEI